MDVLHWVGGTVALAYGLVLVGPRIFALFTIVFAPSVALISETLSGWVATVAAVAALAVAMLVVRGPLRRREEQIRVEHALDG
jgi:membrane protein implicated in regulation of membrane protease activity